MAGFIQSMALMCYITTFKTKYNKKTAFKGKQFRNRCKLITAYFLFKKSLTNSGAITDSTNM